jgi:uncharacterized membrane protein
MTTLLAKEVGMVTVVLGILLIAVWTALVLSKPKRRRRRRGWAHASDGTSIDGEESSAAYSDGCYGGGYDGGGDCGGGDGGGD